MSVDLEGINKKLASMARRLTLLQPYRSLTLDEYLQDETRHATIDQYPQYITEIQAYLDTLEEDDES